MSTNGGASFVATVSTGLPETGKLEAMAGREGEAWLAGGTATTAYGLWRTRNSASEERAEADERRRIELLDLSATTNPPEARIRAWERAHGLTWPRAASHPVLNSVAAATRLTLEQVRDEQRRRLMPVG